MGKVVTFGEVMCRFAPPEHLRIEQVSPGPWQLSFGGAESNVAASIARFGGSAEFVTALPKNAIAESCIRQLNSFGVKTDHICLEPNGRMGIYFVEHGANQRASQVVYYTRSVRKRRACSVPCCDCGKEGGANGFD
jgi:2-dehydro-3-deoxygluconokinase